MAVGVLLFAAGYLAVGALGRTADSSLIVPGRSIGGVALGMTRAQVEAQYGAPDSTLAITLRGGGTGLLATYHVHGGLLLVEYANDHVVSVETTARFYKTEGGAGPGASKGNVHGFHVDYCSGGLWDGTEETTPTTHVTVFTTSGDQIFSVTITEAGYYDDCRTVPVDQEGPDPRGGTAQLTVDVEPDGGGFVRSDPYAIDCPTSCSVPFGRGQTVTLTATPTSGYTFDGWSGACAGTGPCTLTLDDSKVVTANFSGTFVPPPSTTTTTQKTTTGGTQ